MENGKQKMDANNQGVFNEYPLNVRVEGQGTGPNQRNLILSYPRGAKTIDLFRVFQTPDGFSIQPINPSNADFEKFLKDVFEGTFGSPSSSLLDEHYLRQIPTRFSPRGPFATG